MKMRFFDLSKKVAKLSDHYQYQIGATLVKGNKVISVGHNKNKTHTKSNSRYRNTHAELSVLLNCGLQDLSKYKLYLYREKKNGQLGNSKPCEFCQQLLKRVGLRDIYHTSESGFQYSRI